MSNYLELQKKKQELGMVICKNCNNSGFDRWHSKEVFEAEQKAKAEKLESKRLKKLEVLSPEVQAKKEFLAQNKIYRAQEKAEAEKRREARLLKKAIEQEKRFAYERNRSILRELKTKLVGSKGDERQALLVQIAKYKELFPHKGRNRTPTPEAMQKMYAGRVEKQLKAIWERQAAERLEKARKKQEKIELKLLNAEALKEKKRLQKIQCSRRFYAKKINGQYKVNDEIRKKLREASKNFYKNNPEAKLRLLNLGLRVYTFENTLTKERIDITGLKGICEYFKIPNRDYPLNISDIKFSKQYKESDWVFIESKRLIIKKGK